MKPKSLRIIRFILKCACFALVLFLFSAIPVPKNEVRTPTPPYETYEEEYIAAINNYIKAGEIIIPEGTTFSTDGENITIESNESDARVHCRFVIGNSIPVYSSYYSGVNGGLATFIVIMIFTVSFLAYAILNNFFTKIYNTHIFRKNRKALCLKKSSAVHGDNRRKNCKSCKKIDKCKCTSCIHLGLCGNCPSRDCEDTFEEYLEKIKKDEPLSVSEEKTITPNENTVEEEPTETTS